MKLKQVAELQDLLLINSIKKNYASKRWNYQIKKRRYQN